MSFPEKLRFYARGRASVPNIELLFDHSTRAFVGRKLVKDAKGNPVWAPTTGPSEVAFRQEYVKHCQDGELWAADEETAKACGVPFDPTFGDEVKPEPEEAPDAKTAAPKTAPETPDAKTAAPEAPETKPEHAEDPHG